MILLRVLKSTVCKNFIQFAGDYDIHSVYVVLQTILAMTKAFITVHSALAKYTKKYHVW